MLCCFSHHARLQQQAACNTVAAHMPCGAPRNTTGFAALLYDCADGLLLPAATPAPVHPRWGLTLCFREAVHLNLGISIVPHLDDGGGSKAWRNGLVFNPLEQYGGLSYMDIMLHPIADALAAAMRPEPAGFRPATRVWFAMQGEMSATIMRYPLEYISAAQQLKQRIAQARPSAEELVAAHQQAGVTVWDEATGAQALLEPVNLRTAGRGALPESLVKMGVSFNFNKVRAGALLFSSNFHTCMTDGGTQAHGRRRAVALLGQR